MSPDADESIEARLGAALRETDATLAIAESCTGGLVGSLVTDVPGSSEYFECSVVSYTYRAKRALLSINRETLDAHGAVSEPVAGEMAAAIRDTADATWGISTTGVAGPDGGSDETPVGTVYIGVAYAAPWETQESNTTVERFEFDGTRHEIKERIARQSLESTLDRVHNQNP